MPSRSRLTGRNVEARRDATVVTGARSLAPFFSSTHASNFHKNDLNKVRRVRAPVIASLHERLHQHHRLRPADQPSAFLGLLQTASFRGVPFKVIAARVKKGRCWAIHEYPYVAAACFPLSVIATVVPVLAAVDCALTVYGTSLAAVATQVAAGPPALDEGDG